MLKFLPYIIICLLIFMGGRVFDILQSNPNTHPAEKLAQAEATNQNTDNVQQVNTNKPADLDLFSKNVAQEREQKNLSKNTAASSLSKKQFSDMPNMKCLSSAQSAFSPTEIELLTSLKSRREELEDREQELMFKENVIKMTRDQIDERIKMLSLLKDELQEIMAQYNIKEDEKNARLVKVYESMKPRDAAKIFEEMQLNILLEVIEKMRETRLAPILASMEPFKAKEITVALVNKRKAIRNIAN